MAGDELWPEAWFVAEAHGMTFICILIEVYFTIEVIKRIVYCMLPLLNAKFIAVESQ